MRKGYKLGQEEMRTRAAACTQVPPKTEHRIAPIISACDVIEERILNLPIYKTLPFGDEKKSKLVHHEIPDAPIENEQTEMEEMPVHLL